MPAPLTQDELAALRRLSSPTVSNAIETLNVRHRDEGFMDHSVRCMFPELGVMVGYAVTAVYQAAVPAPSHRPPPLRAYWEYVQTMPAPRVVVGLDMDDKPGLGANWGDVQANIHRALGCIGGITNGAVRDLDEVRALGFHFFAAHVAVSHAYSHLVDFGVPVRIGGLTVHPGDLIHADQHGVVLIPQEVARDVIAAAERVAADEAAIIAVCQSPDFSVERLQAAIRARRST